jgi:hypothetical protein
MFFNIDKWSGIGVAFIAFLLSPWGLPAIADWLIQWATEFKYTLREFIRS